MAWLCITVSDILSHKSDLFCNISQPSWNLRQAPRIISKQTLLSELVLCCTWIEVQVAHLKITYFKCWKKYVNTNVGKRNKSNFLKYLKQEYKSKS